MGWVTPRSGSMTSPESSDSQIESLMVESMSGIFSKMAWHR
jgi:hypothetical protein